MTGKTNKQVTFMELIITVRYTLLLGSRASLTIETHRKYTHTRSSDVVFFNPGCCIVPKVVEAY